MDKEIIMIEELKTYFKINKDKKNPAYIRAVDGVSFNINKGDVMGLVGESGSGKSTIAYTIMGMHNPKEGKIIFNGTDIANKKRNFEFKKKVQIVFQDPGSSLNPYQNVRQILSLPLKTHKIVGKNKIEEKIIEVLKTVDLPSNIMYASPDSIGGGEKQLVSIARALCSNPEFIILDEPTSSLDVSIQAKIINMLLKIQKMRALTYLFITHDLSLMRNIANKVAIMYLGKICEIAPTEDFFKNPLHPYTQMLLSAIPVMSDEEEGLKPKTVNLKGEIPSPVNIPQGCSFHTRCDKSIEICSQIDPLMKVKSTGHYVRCHLYNGN